MSSLTKLDNTVEATALIGIAPTAKVHPTACIEAGAALGDNVEIGPFVYIGPEVKIGANTKVGASTVIVGRTTIGHDCNIYSHVSIGQDPQDLKYKGEATGVAIGNNVTLREFVSIHKATGEGLTIVGDDCFFMAYVHIGHNCQVGKGVIMANNVTLAGHVTMGDYVVCSGTLMFHQFVRVGRLAMMSALSGARQDIPPFSMCDGRPLSVRATNVVGMRRQNMNQTVRSAIKHAFKLIYGSNLNVTQALERIEAEIEQFDEVKELVAFYRSSKRGVAPKFVTADNFEEEVSS